MISRVFEWGVRIVVIISLTFSFLAYQNQHDLSKCVAQWADDYTTTATARTVANTNRLNALHSLLVDAVTNPAGAKANAAQEEVLEAVVSGDTELFKVKAQVFLDALRASRTDPQLLMDVQNFVETERQYTETIKDHPIPDPPKEVCK